MKGELKKSCTFRHATHPHGAKICEPMKWMVCNDGNWEDGALRTLIEHHYMIP